MSSTPIRALSGALTLLVSASCWSPDPTPASRSAAPVIHPLPGGTPIAIELVSPAEGALVASPPGGVRVVGTVSIGEAVPQPDTTLVYALEATAAVAAAASCGDAATVLACEVAALAALNARAAALGTVGDVGAVIFGASGEPLDVGPAEAEQRLVAPGADGDAAGGPDVLEALASVLPDGTAARFGPVTVGGGPVQVGSGLAAAFAVAAESTRPARTVVLLSASTNAAGPGPGDLVVPEGVVVRAFALPGTTCAAGLDAFAARGAPGSGCEDVADLTTLAGRVSATLDAELLSLELVVDGGTPVPLLEDALPAPAPYAGSFETQVTGLAPGAHALCVRASGRDAGGTGSDEVCASVKVATLAVSPPEAIYELGAPGQTATITATVAAGAAGGVEGAPVAFAVRSGPNAGKAETVTTDAEGRAAFTYEALQHLEGLGTDAVEACFTDSGGTAACATASVTWRDTTPPVVACLPGPNPGGKSVTQDGGLSPSGFMVLVATDAVDPAPLVSLVDTGSGTAWGPYGSGLRVKYTQAPGATPSAREMGGGVLHVKGNGDPAVHGKDALGNEAEPVVCRVPPGKS